MKTNIAIAALAACTLTAQAVTINVTYHTFDKVSIAFEDIHIQGYTPHREEYEISPYISILGISANSASDGVTYVAINWVTPWYQREDSFAIGPWVMQAPRHHADSQRLLPSGAWEFTYNRPDDYGVPDNGSVLAGLGVALIGLWRIKR